MLVPKNDRFTLWTTTVEQYADGNGISKKIFAMWELKGLELHEKIEGHNLITFSLSLRHILGYSFTKIKMGRRCYRKKAGSVDVVVVQGTWLWRRAPR